MPVDLAAVARLVKATRGDASQGDFAKSVGLSQGQLSKIETCTYRRLPHDVAKALEKAIGAPLPETDADSARQLPELTAPTPQPRRRVVLWLQRSVAEVKRLVGEDHPIFAMMAQAIEHARQLAEEVSGKGPTLAKKSGRAAPADIASRRKKK